MVKFSLALILVLAGVFALHAKDPAAYSLGDTAETDITTPVALDVIDPVATALLKETERLKTPALFREFNRATTNAMARDFLATFATTRTNFLAAANNVFHQTELDEAAISSPEFANFITTFNKSNNFPVSPALAAQWAGGDAGLNTQTKWLGGLLSQLRQPVRPDALPEDFVIGDTVRLVPVGGPDETPTLDAAQNGPLILASSLTTLSRAKTQFRGEFTVSEQPLALALANLIRPNCVPDAMLTLQARERDVPQFSVVDHYDAGQVIIRRGEMVDVKTKVALDQLHEKLIPVELNFQLAVEQEHAEKQSQRERDAATNAAVSLQSLRIQASDERARNEWLTGTLGVLAGVTLAALWQLTVQRRRVTTLALARQADLQLPSVSSDIAVHLAQAVKEALLQELAAQRVELLKAQQNAATELAKLVKRLDELQIPLQERLNSYETQVKKLGTEEATPIAPAQVAASAFTATSDEAEYKNGNGTPAPAAGDQQKSVPDLLAEGQSLLNANQPEQALQCFEAALALEPGHAEALIKKGGALERLGRLDEAITCYDRAIEADGSMTIAYLHKGGLFNRMARYDEAMQCYEKALQTQGKVPA
jgi:tetratricopeptide (TPR) repeat protein